VQPAAGEELGGTLKSGKRNRSHYSLKIGALLETEKHDVGDILRESLEHEQMALAAYYDLVKIAEGKSVLLEEYARELIVEEELHLDEVNKMLRRPGAIEPFKG
jgi:bacterioferritin